MNEHETPESSELKRRRGSRFGAIAGAGLLAALLALGLTSVASAQTVVEDPVAPTEPATTMTFMQVEGDEGDGHDDDYEPNAEEQAVFDRFEQCMSDAGVDEASEAELDEATVDAAFEQCDPILDELGDEFFDDMDLSPADEAIFDRYDECLQGAGLDFESEAELDDATVDAAFEQCDPVLDELSDEAQELFGDCPEEE